MILTYEFFVEKLNEKIKSDADFCYELLKNVIDNPHRYTGIFRLSNAKTKLIQNVTQSREIKFGDFMEDIVTLYIEKMGYNNLNKRIGTDENGDALLNVSTNKDKFIPNESVYNFRLFYKVLISMEIKGDAPFTEEEVAEKVANEEPYLVFTYKDRSNQKTELAFYRYSTRRSLITVNGRGQFYVYTDILDKISNDVVRVLNDEEIDSYGKN